MILQRKTSKSVEQVRRDFRRAARRLGLVVFGMHDIKDDLMRKGYIVNTEFLVFEFSYPQALQNALTCFTPTVAVAPMRLAVYREGGETRLCTLSLVEFARAVKKSRFISRKLSGPWCRQAAVAERKLKSLMKVLCSNGAPSSRRRPR